MLLTIQFPIVDLRAFVTTQTGKLSIPSWLTPIPDHDFVRSFGIIRRRPRGGLSGWLGECMICEASRAIRFTSIEPYEGHSGHYIRFKVVFRRFYFDGIAVGKFEIGLAAKYVQEAGFLPSNQARELFYRFLRLPVVLPNPKGEKRYKQLWGIGQPLASLYLLSSTRTQDISKGTEKPKEWWVQPCETIIVTTYDPDESFVNPFWGRTVPSIDFNYLSHHVIPIEGKNLRIWMFEESGFRDWRSQRRELRIFLLRLHAEQECFRQVLRNIATGRLIVAPRSAQSDRLQYYFNVATRRIKRLAEHSKHDEPEVGELAREAEDYINPGERDALFQALDGMDIRKNINDKVKDFVTQQIIIKEQIMGDKYTVGQAGVVGPHGHAHDMTFNQIWNQSASDIDLPTLAKELSTLRTALKKETKEPQHDSAVGEIASAEIAAMKGDGPGALQHLAKAGKWAFEIATKIGVTVAAAALKVALGL